MGIEQIKAQSRRALHGFMGRAALYYDAPHQTKTGGVAIKARYHSNTAKAGDLAGTNLSYAELRDRSEEIVFWREEIADPVRNALVVFGPDEGYFVNNTLPADGQTVTSEVVRAAPKDLKGFTAPDGTLIGG